MCRGRRACLAAAEWGAAEFARLQEELADPKVDKRWKKISGGPPGMRIMGMSLPGPGGPGAVRRRPPDTRGRRMESGTTTCVFQVAGEIRNVSLAAVVATMEGTDLAARRAWDPSTDELRILAKQGHDDIIHWVGPAPGTAPLHTPATLHASSPQTTCCPLLRILFPNPVPSSQRALPRSFRARARREALRTRGRPMQVTDFPWPLSDREYLYRRAPTLPPPSVPSLTPAHAAPAAAPPPRRATR
jgi:hypothetical protein